MLEILVVLALPLARAFPQDPPAEDPDVPVQDPVAEAAEEIDQALDLGDEPVQDPTDDISVTTAEDQVQRELFGADRTLELTVERALRVAETNNFGLQLEDVTTEVARFNAAGSWGAFDWVFNANGNYLDGTTKPSRSFEGNDEIETTRHFYDLGFTRPMETGGNFSATFDSNKMETTSAEFQSDALTEAHLRLAFMQPLLRGFGSSYATAIQRESEVAFRKQTEHRREVLQKLLSDVHNAYWNLVQTRQQLEVAGSSLDLGLEQLERNERMLEAGVGTEVEVIQAKAEVARRVEVLLAADVAVRDAGDALKILLFPGKDVATWDTELIPITPLPEVVSAADLAPWEQLLSVATQYRSEIRQQRMQIQIAEIRHERSLSEKKVGLDVDIALQTQGLDLGEGDAIAEAFSLDYPTYTAGLRFNAPIRNRTARYAEKAARAEVRAAHIVFDQLETQVIGEVRNAVRQVRYQAEAVRAATESLVAAQRQLAAEEARYRNDLSTNFQVLEYQQTLVQAMNTEQTARVEYMKSLSQLEFAQGILGETGR